MKQSHGNESGRNERRAKKILIAKRGGVERAALPRISEIATGEGLVRPLFFGPLHHHPADVNPFLSAPFFGCKETGVARTSFIWWQLSLMTLKISIWKFSEVVESIRLFF
jgi:hypothetical protein